MELFWLSLCVLLKPVSTFRVIPTTRGRFRWLPLLLLAALLVAANLCYLELLHYPLQEKSPLGLNLTLEVAVMLLPLLGWAAASFCTTSIMDGETKMSECIYASFTCMMPYIILAPLLTLLSHMLTNQDEIFFLLQGAMWIWCIALQVLSVGVMNEYSLGKTLLVTLLNLLLMAVLAAVALLMYALCYQMWIFLKDLWLEIRYVLA